MPRRRSGPSAAPRTALALALAGGEPLGAIGGIGALGALGDSLPRLDFKGGDEPRRRLPAAT